MVPTGKYADTDAQVFLLNNLSQFYSGIKSGRLFNQLLDLYRSFSIYWRK